MAFVGCTKISYCSFPWSFLSTVIEQLSGSMYNITARPFPFKFFQPVTFHQLYCLQLLFNFCKLEVSNTYKYDSPLKLPVVAAITHYRPSELLISISLVIKITKERKCVTGRIISSEKKIVLYQWKAKKKAVPANPEDKTIKQWIPETPVL